MANPLLLFDVDKDLAADHTGSVVKRIESQLINTRNDCKAALDAGLPWDEAKKIESVSQALGVALNLLPRLREQLKT